MGSAGEDEVLDPVSSASVDEMLEDFEDRKASNPKDRDTPCRGNIATECMRDGMRNLSQAQEDMGIKAAVYGGIGTQLRALEGFGDVFKVMDRFGRRETGDIDVLVPRGQARSLEQEVERLEGGNAGEVHAKSGYIPGSDEMIERSERIDFSEYHEDMDFELDVLTGTDLLYSKVFKSPGNKDGTKYDIEMMTSEPDIFGVDADDLARTIHEHAPDPEDSYTILRSYGMDIR